MQVTLVQEASTLDPDDNRERLAELTPEGSDLVVFPEAFARDFGEPGSDLSAAAEPLDGPFATEVARVAAQRGTTVLAGMFETGDDPARPVNTLVLRGAAHADYRKIHLYDSFGYRESDRVTAGPLDAGDRRPGGPADRPDDLLRPALPRAGPGPGRRRRARPWSCRPPGWPGRARSTTGPRWRGPGPSRTRRTSSAVGQPGPRYTGHSIVVDPLGEVLAEAGEKPETLNVTLEPEVVDAARRTNPSLANRRL